MSVAGAKGEFPLQRGGEGCFQSTLPAYQAGDLYGFRVDGQGPFPDPASRRQPQGVHGPSEIVDPLSFVWRDAGWRGLASLRDHVFYELHVGAFSPEGSFDGARRRLSYLKELGVTAIELMPLADFPGERNWGYDGVALFAPARCYGTPDDLRRLVDEAHGLGLAIYIDVVYNHFGPDGNYTGVYSPFYFTDRHSSPWGAGVNLDGEGARFVREFLMGNACHWIREYHFDGLRLDATHALADDSPRHFLAELADRARQTDPRRAIHIIAEDSRNLARIVKPETEGGWGLDGVWSDDLHHHIRRALAGDSDGYFADFSGSPSDIASTLNAGWFFRGQVSNFEGKSRGTDPRGIPPERFVVCLQNHDQVGNRALGERLHHQIDAASHRAAAALLLAAPETPLIFMGQEWAASTPFLYFTDHERDLGRRITQGRREEFKSFRAFADPTARERIPDPQDPAAFFKSRLEWDERDNPDHGMVLAYYKALLSFRRENLTAARTAHWDFHAEPVGESALALRRGPFTFLVQLKGAGSMEVLPSRAPLPPPNRVVLSSEDRRFCVDPLPSVIETSDGRTVVRFQRPGALILCEDEK